MTRIYKALLLLAVVVSPYAILHLSPRAWAVSGELIESARPVPIGSGTPLAAVQTTWRILDAETSTATGVWVDFRGHVVGRMVTSGISAGATIQIHCSLDETKPADATDGNQLGSNITTNTLTTFAGPCRWVKAKITVNAGDTVTAILMAHTIGMSDSVSLAAGGTSSGVGDAVPGEATPMGGDDGTNLQIPRVYDVNTGGSTEYTLGANLRFSGASGSVEGFTSDNPGIVEAKIQGANNMPTIISTASINATAVVAQAAVVTSLTCQNASSTAAAFLHLYNATSAPTPANDTGAHIKTYACGAAGGSGQYGGVSPNLGPDGLGQFTDGVALTITGSNNDALSTNAPEGVILNLEYVLPN